MSIANGNSVQDECIIRVAEKHFVGEVDAFDRHRVWAAPHCGLVWLPVEPARAKLRALMLGARLSSENP